MESQFSYPASVPDWNNLDVLHKNILPSRATFYIYDNEADAISRDVSRSKTLCLSGTWKFNLEPYPLEPSPKFYSHGYDTSKWGTIEVPGMWQLQGYGKGPQYTNVIYPWPVDPPNVPLDNNETGYYLRTFKVPANFKGHQLRLRFEGVDSAFHIWVNGNDVGYSQGSRNPSEFDVTEFVDEEKENNLAVRVYQRCDGSYIEDQDQWWLSGIFRDVNLLAFPKVHIKDFKVVTDLDSKYTDAVLAVDVELSTATSVNLKLLDKDMNVIKETSQSSLSEETSVQFKLRVTNPHKWTAETPYLYYLVLSLENAQVVTQRIGFRKSEIKDGLLLVNGKPLCFRGVNRHEHHPVSGRTIPLEFLRQDLLLMKTHNINGIRTSHQPNDSRLYDLADELGFWVIDEADLECHGFTEVEDAALEEKYKRLSPAKRQAVSYSKATRWTSDNPDWEAAYVDRAKQLVMRDKNHACVVIWSLGNEAFYGRNHQAMYDWIVSYDTTRPIHYEGDWEAETVDFYSRMYPSVDEIIEFATKDKTWTKPLILCEFVHAMGNGPGAIKEYIDAFYKYPRLQGGFVWEWANHGLLTKNKNGEEYYAYGGDFGDLPNDGNFVMDGLLHSNHTPTPGLIEYKKAIEPVQVLEESTYDKVIIINRYDFLTLDHLRCEWSVVGDGFMRPREEIVIPAGIEPGKTAELVISGLSLAELSSESYIELRFTLKESTQWADAGHEVACSQVLIKPGKSIATLTEATSGSCPTIKKLSPSILEISGSEAYKWQFDLVRGELLSWQESPKALLHKTFSLDFYRALTDNDRPQDGEHWLSKRLDQATTTVRSTTVSIDQAMSSVKIIVKARIAPPVFEWSVDTTTTFTFRSRSVAIHVVGKPQGINLPRTFARIGLAFSLHSSITQAEWFGRGSGESYKDKKLSQHFGNWTMPIDELFTNYEYPQESGNRTDIRWVRFFDDKKSAGSASKGGLKASFGTQDGCSFSASHFEMADVDECRHPYELEKKRKDEVIVRLDWDHHGIGTGSCGPKTLPQYELLSKDFEFEVLLE